jgi:RimJ/RimL family protein N-acetyltransferase
MGHAGLDLPLRTARLTLRQLRGADAPALRRIVTVPDVGRMLFAFPPDWSEAGARAFVAEWQYWPGCARFRLAIEDGGGALIGTVGMWAEGAAARDPQVFYFLDPAHAGRGLATEAMAAFIAALFTGFDIDTLGADVFADNPRSARVLAKLGFGATGLDSGTSAARLEPAPIVLYRLSRSNWKANAP